MSEEGSLKQFTVTQQTAVVAKDAKDALTKFMAGEGSIMSMSASYRGGMVQPQATQPAPTRPQSA